VYIAREPLVILNRIITRHNDLAIWIIKHLSITSVGCRWVVAVLHKERRTLIDCCEGQTVRATLGRDRQEPRQLGLAKELMQVLTQTEIVWPEEALHTYHV
jgi:hypothetical protein